MAFQLMRRGARSWLAGSLGVGFLCLMAAGRGAGEETAPKATLSPQAAEAVRLIQSDDPYQCQIGFLRLEALRDPGTVSAIQPSLMSREAQRRAWSLRALAAIEGPASVPVLLEALKTDWHPRVRRAALLGLEPLFASDPAMILPAFLKALRDRKPDVRMTALDLVSRIETPRAREAILMRNKRERDRNVRRVLELAMKRLRTAPDGR